jgi:XTP/dITP diphosphohydrolase
MTEPQHPELDALIEVMATLRSDDGCAWDREQTHESLLKYLIEESHEFIDAVESGDRTEMREELGDVLYQVLFHADLAASHPTEPFTIDDVARVVREKMVGRHPHVFGDVVADTADEVSANWEKWKAAEKPERTSVFDGIPAGLPALALADTVLRKAGGARVTPFALPSESSEEDLGALLLGIVAAAREQGLDAETALRRAVRQVMDDPDVLTS